MIYIEVFPNTQQSNKIKWKDFRVEFREHEQKIKLLVQKIYSRNLGEFEDTKSNITYK